jgi:hypothetical protein
VVKGVTVEAWRIDDKKRILYLLTPEEYALVPDGVALIDVGGKAYIKGTNPIDMNTSFGHLSVGLWWDDASDTDFIEAELKNNEHQQWQ